VLWRGGRSSRWRTSGGLQGSQVNRESGLEPAWQPLHARSKILRNVKERSVSGLFENNLIAGIEHRRHGQVICHRCSGCGDNTFFGNPGMFRDSLLKRSIAIVARRSDF
jgi:hypothetical protein